MVNRLGAECEPLFKSATAGHECLLLEWDALRYVGMRCGPIPGTRARTSRRLPPQLGAGIGQRQWSFVPVTPQCAVETQIPRRIFFEIHVDRGGGVQGRNSCTFLVLGGDLRCGIVLPLDGVPVVSAGLAPSGSSRTEVSQPVCTLTP